LRMFQTQLEDSYPTYGQVPQSLKNTWFRSFTQYYNWDPEITPLVRDKFNEHASQLYSDHMYTWKQKYLQGKKPKNINEGVIEGLIPYWELPETQATSATNSKNRRSEREGRGMSTHNAGAKTIEPREEEMTIEAGGIPPNYIELIEDIHTNKKTKRVQDPKAREFLDMAKGIRDERNAKRIQLGLDPMTREDINEMVVEIAPVNKNGIFGLGKLVDRHKGCIPTPINSTLAEEVKILKEQHLEKDARLDSLQLELQTLRNILKDNFPSAFPPTQQPQ